MIPDFKLWLTLEEMKLKHVWENLFSQVKTITQSDLSTLIQLKVRKDQSLLPRLERLLQLFQRLQNWLMNINKRLVWSINLKVWKKIGRIQNKDKLLCKALWTSPHWNQSNLIRHNQTTIRIWLIYSTLRSVQKMRELNSNNFKILNTSKRPTWLTTKKINLKFR